MKRIIVGIIVAMFIMSTTSYAEEKMHEIDVLEDKEMEVIAEFAYYRSSGYVSHDPSGAAVESNKRKVSLLTNTLNVGLGHSLEVGVQVPYAFSDKIKHRSYASPSATRDYKTEGFGDISLLSKYRIVGEGDKPFTMVAGLDVKLETASQDDWGSGTTNISPSVAVSTKVGESLQPWAGYTATIRDHGARDTHSVILAAIKELNERAGFEAWFDASFHTSSDHIDSNESYNLGIETYVGMYRDLYAVLGVVFGTETSFDLRDVDQHVDSTTTSLAYFRLYYLF